MSSRRRALRLLHPFPSALNASLVLALALVAGADAWSAVALAVGMLGIQFCIGATNDVVDVSLDAYSKPWKPAPAGLVSIRAATAIAAGSGAIGLVASLTQGIVPAVLAAAMLGCGLLYDLRLKPTAWAWACFSVAFALLPIYAWYGAIGELPPLPGLLIPLAALAGPALQLSNGLVDLEDDAASGLRTLATRLGRRRTLAAIAILVAVIHGVAWATLSATVGGVSLVVAAASLLAAVGFALQTRRDGRARATGWSLQAIGIALLGLGWLAAVA